MGSLLRMNEVNDRLIVVVEMKARRERPVVRLEMHTIGLNNLVYSSSRSYPKGRG